MAAERVESVAQVADRLRESVGRVIVGKREPVDLLLVALLCEGHVLIEDVPGIGKTMLAKAVARSLDCSFQRIQFTPDLLPSDVTGASVFNQRTGDFAYRPGPVLSQVVLADEINRATPRTQAALLEIMEERQVTVDGVAHPAPRPFLVLATQNPIELEGTFPLPEAQLDRFFLRLRMGYPDEAEEMEIVARFRVMSPLETLEPIVTSDTLLAMQRACREVHVSPDVQAYIVRLVRATRQHPAIELGASPRATLALTRGAQALAAMAGRDFVLPDDAKALAVPVMGHRVLLNPQAQLRGRSVDALVRECVDAVAVPVEAEPVTS